MSSERALPLDPVHRGLARAYLRRSLGVDSAKDAAIASWAGLQRAAAPELPVYLTPESSRQERGKLDHRGHERREEEANALLPRSHPVLARNPLAFARWRQSSTSTRATRTGRSCGSRAASATPRSGAGIGTPRSSGGTTCGAGRRSGWRRRGR